MVIPRNEYPFDYVIKPVKEGLTTEDQLYTFPEGQTREIVVEKQPI